MSQNAMILKDLKAGKVITPIIALKKYNCFRLAARIRDLKDRGHKINTTMQRRKDKRFAAYWI